MNHGERAKQLIDEEAWSEHWGETSEALTVALIHAVLDLADAVRGVASTSASDIGLDFYGTNKPPADETRSESLQVPETWRVSA